MLARRAILAVPALALAAAGCNLIFGIEPPEATGTGASASSGSSGSTATGTGGNGGTGGHGGLGGTGGCAPSSCLAGECPVEELTPGHASETKGMVVTADRVLWANGAAIEYVNKDGSGQGALGGTSGFGSTIWVALEGGLLSWVNYDGNVVRGISIDPASPSPIVIADLPPQNGYPVQSLYGRIAAHGDTVYWATQDPVGTLWRAKADGSQPFEEVAASTWPFGIAIDATHVYWADAADFKIYRKPTASIGAAAETFADANGRPTEIVLSGGELFWVTDGGAVQSKATSAAPSAEPFTYTVDPMVISKSIAVDDAFVYWTVYRNEHQSGRGEVRRAHRGGSDMTTLAVGQPYFFEIAVDCGFIYWNVNNLDDGAPGTVFRMPKPSN